MKRLLSVRNNRGFTLAELVIVLVLTGIMTVMVISFTVIVSGWSQTGTHRYDLVSAERLATNALRTFVSAYDSVDYHFDTDESGRVLTARRVDDSETYTFRLEDGVLRYLMPSGTDAEMALDYIENMRLIVSDGVNGRQMISMRLQYSLPHTTANVRDVEGEYVVLVCTRTATGGTP